MNIEEIITQEELIIDGLKWLSIYKVYRDAEMDKSHGKAVVYATTLTRVVSRVKDQMERPGGLQWLHDTLLLLKLDKEIGILFYKMWSKKYNEVRQIENRIIKEEPILRSKWTNWNK